MEAEADTSVEAAGVEAPRSASAGIPSPTAPGTALVVGVTSHRDLDPSQLPALREQVRAALAGLCEQFPSLSLVLTQKPTRYGKATSNACSDAENCSMNAM